MIGWFVSRAPAAIGESAPSERGRFPFGARRTYNVSKGDDLLNDSSASAATLAPVTAAERIQIIDVLRGFALLGILMMNIEFFALPSAVYFDPRVAGGFSGLDLATWNFGYVFFLQKMMGLFSMLFGAGVVLWYERARAAGGRIGGAYYRRTIWLLAFGMIHGYLIWYGDILFTYATAGLFLFLLRRRSPRSLLVIGVGVLLFGSAVQWGSGMSMSVVRDDVARIESTRPAGESLTDSERAIIRQWELWEQVFAPGAEHIHQEIQYYRGNFRENLRFRLPQNLMMQTQGMLFFVLWRAAGMMLLGMALMKWGVLSGGRSTRFYTWLTLVGAAGGIGLSSLGARGLLANDFDFVYRFIEGNQYNYWGSILMTLAYVGALNLVWRFGPLKGLTRRLAAVGRMAFSNYIMHSVVCTTIFYGFGFGLFNELSRFQMIWIVMAIWIAQLYLSPWWLSRFRFGPLEWLWRTLTYMRSQPMRVVRS